MGIRSESNIKYCLCSSLILLFTQNFEQEIWHRRSEDRLENDGQADVCL